MSQCHFCGGQFRNAQSVRAHLKACSAYEAKKFDDQKPALGEELPKGSFPIESASMPQMQRGKRPSSEIKQLNEKLQKEKLRRAIKKIQPRATTNLLDLDVAFRRLIPDLKLALWWEFKVSLIPQEPGKPGYKEVDSLCRDFKEAYLQVKTMVSILELDFNALPLIYLQMKDLRDRWERYRKWCAPEDLTGPDPLKEVMPAIKSELVKFDDILTILRRVMP